LDSSNFLNQQPETGVIVDSRGDLFGTTIGLPGSGFTGTVFELVNNGTVANPSYAHTLLDAFTKSFGLSGLTADANGDLFFQESLAQPGLPLSTTVNELVNTGTVAAPSYTQDAITTLGSLSGIEVSGADQNPGDLTLDAKGDLFGAVTGSVFELVNTGTIAAPSYTSGVTTLASLGASGANGGLLLDANGDLFGTTPNGGVDNDGTVFEIVNTGTVAAPSYASTPITLVNFHGTDGSTPNGGLLLDANGNLFGTTQGGGLSGNGTAFEVPAGLYGAFAEPSATENYTLDYTATEGGGVTLGAALAVGNVTITGLPPNSSNFNGGTYTSATNTWVGTVAQYDLLKFTAGNAGTYALSIATTTNTGTPVTESDALIVDQAAPVLGGATNDVVTDYGTAASVTLGATDTAAFTDDTLGNVTITGLPTDLTGFNGGAYTSATGTWVGTAAAFNALTFDAGPAPGIYTLSISATTTGAEAGAPTTESYTLAVQTPFLTLASGGSPTAGLTADANGDLFGTTPGVGVGPFGTVFELVNNGTVSAPSYSSPVQLPAPEGNLITGGVTLDAHGDLFGTTAAGTFGTAFPSVFEIINTGTVAAPSYISPTTLDSNDFSGPLPGIQEQSQPETGVIVDSRGDVFGTTAGFPIATVFELVNNGTVANPSYAYTLLESTSTSTSSAALSGLTADANGDLFYIQAGPLTAGTTVNELVNTGTVAAPSYTAISTLGSLSGIANNNWDT
jgi:hypothetical protein